jgi:hypothetical protein
MNYRLLLLFVALWGMACRELETVIEIELEEEPSELVVECYLRPGEPFRLLLTETKPYFDPVNACPFVRNALVVITHQGQRDTLQEAVFTGRGCSTIQPFFDNDSIRFYNYGSDKICSYTTTDDFLLEVWDLDSNRYATARTRFLPVVPVSRLDYGDFTNEADLQTIVTMGCEDDLQQNNYYRFTLHKNRLWKTDTNSIFQRVASNPKIDIALFDQGVYTDGEIFQRSNYDFYNNDVAIATIYHIDKAYYDYLITSTAAYNANLNPFFQPAKVKSNLQGAQGIFTALAFDRRALLVQR